MDRLRALTVFKTVAEQGGFARAAGELEVSCANVTRTVQDLELLLGVQLLHRTTRRVSLTAVGREVLTRASDLLDSYDELAALSSLAASEPAGTVRLSAPAAYGRHCLGPALAQFQARCPKVRVDLQLRDGPVDIVDDEIDVALCFEGELKSSLIARRVASVERGLYAAPAYLAAHGRPLEPAALQQHNCLTGDDADSAAGWQFRQPGSAGVCVPVRGSLRASHSDVLVGAAVHGAGIVMLPRFMAETALARGSLVPLMDDWRCEPLTIHVAYGSRRNQPLRVRKLIDHLVETLPDDDSAADDDATRMTTPLHRRPAGLVPHAVATLP